MNEKRVDTYRALLAFEVIRTKGNKQADEYYYQGLFASHSFDGYTVCIRDQSVILNLFFHNKYEVKFDKADQLDKFLKKLYALCE